MSSLPLKRARALSAACRGAQPSRLVHSSSVNQATALSSAAFAEEVAEITLPPMFDIFDAPTKLAQSGEFIRSKYASAPKTLAAASPAPSPALSTRPGPAPLPPAILFDGPARPQNGMLAFQSRLRDAGLRAPPPVSRARRSTVSARPFSSAEPLVQIFDGPAKITRYHHRPAGSEQNSAAYMVALGVVGTVGCATLLRENDNSP
ncbi:hypothetical protein HYPSUDRAFT_561211 [Hypholoma sublateritium FD-334 SS-4]|uniref:Uncharacterized protein n=1 Tax=Hypholoma sublateritium (strain FD-334 SS-4) TaxID=945553 RepID=A0A0D2PWJ2_HYPSF|nr:hypothetical protein HYPSUDRAFT_561211 [Hypholoma sublateritium FD-334 SS-4]